MTDDNVLRIIDERQMWLLCIKAEQFGAGKAKEVHEEIVHVLMAWSRGELCPRSKTPLLNAVLSKARHGPPPGPYAG